MQLELTLALLSYLTSPRLNQLVYINLDSWNVISHYEMCKKIITIHIKYQDSKNHPILYHIPRYEGTTFRRHISIANTRTERNPTLACKVPK